MAKKCKCPPTGAPEWVLTYGDMMSLLLVFFIMIVAMSEIKKEDQFKAVVEEVQKAFGMQGGGGKLPTHDDPELSFIEKIESLLTRKRIEPNQSNATDPGMEGPEASVTTVREGLEFTTGGRSMFDPGSADLNEYGRHQLLRVVQREHIRGTNNIIELRGHAEPMELTVNPSGYPDLWTLSFARARSVMRYLTGDAVGLRAQRFRLVAAADHAPLVKRAYTASQQAPNRRVEMVVTESLVQDFAKPQAQTGR